MQGTAEETGWAVDRVRGPAEATRGLAESVNVQELVSEKGRAGEVTVAAGRSIYACLFGLLLEK